MKQSADMMPRSCLERDRLQGPRDVGRRPSWKYQELFQLGEVALPSREGSVDGDGVLGGVYSGRFQTGRSLRAQSQEQPLCLKARGSWSSTRETQSRQSSQGTSVLALPHSTVLGDTG